LDRIKEDIIMLKYKIATGQTETDILTEYGVHVSGSTGLVGRPDFKTPTHRFSWDYLNGESIDLRQRRYKPREIKLKCWLKANTKQTAIEKLNTFLKAFDTQNLIRLHVEFVVSDPQQTGMKGLFYLVYLSKTDAKNVLWRTGKQILTFDITLTEPSPIKRVYKLTATDIGRVEIDYLTTSEIDIHWGDGDVTYDCYGEGSTTHYYTSTGIHYIMIVGVISEIKEWSIDASHELAVTLIYDEI
jgi:hypothetical protein